MSARSHTRSRRRERRRLRASLIRKQRADALRQEGKRRRRGEGWS